MPGTPSIVPQSPGWLAQAGTTGTIGCSARGAAHQLLRQSWSVDVSTSKELSWSRAAMAAKVPATGGTLAVVSMLLAILTVFTVVVNGQIVFPEDERGVRECGVGEVCVAKDSCLEYKKKLQQRRDATAQDNPEERAKMVEQLRAMVCHKTEKKVCCPVTKGKNGELVLESERVQQKLTFLAKTGAHTIRKCFRWLSWIK